MTRMASRLSRSKKDALQVVHPHAAAIDVGSRFYVVAIPPDQDALPVRTFNTFTGDLCLLADWLGEKQVTIVAMESTGVYCIPVYELIEECRFDVILANARDAKTSLAERPTSTMPSGYNACMPTDCYAAVSAPLRNWRACVLPFASVSTCWPTPLPISSICRSADRDEPSAPSCRDEYYRCDGHAHSAGHCRGAASPDAPSRVPRTTMQGQLGNDSPGPERTLP
ncbi:hypothetical protein DFO67_12926 [Modicisalibacter xianhensis]|uniref:Transposase n=1 Tax=Modicisalibacter xianhensis TaxID=442341 RepID=A0A4V3GSD8_9GAMM|nr:hypothetical protein DFO67_12926 [Halomonas xianhensis]